jgi:hypothetical protein
MNQKIRNALLYLTGVTLFLGGITFIGESRIYSYEKSIRSPETKWYAVPFEGSILQRAFREEDGPGYNDIEKYLSIVAEKNNITDFTRQKPAKICLPDIDRDDKVAGYSVNELEPCNF